MDQDDILQLIENCEERDQNMTDWECRFIDSLSFQIEKEIRLTDKQILTLENIHDKVTVQG
jgi:hypothetical protein